MENLAVGFIEVEGYAIALACINRLDKELAIEVAAIDCNNPKNEATASIPLTVQIIVKGMVAEISEALEIAKREALNYLSIDKIHTSMLARGAADLKVFTADSKVMPFWSYEMSKRKENQKFLQREALAIIELQHYTNAICLTNQLLQSYELHYEHHEASLGGRLLTLIFSGSTSQVAEAVRLVRQEIKQNTNSIYTALQLNYPATEVLRYIIHSPKEEK